MQPWHKENSITIYNGDALETLQELEAGSVQSCITSPPYWGLRDYGISGQIGLEESPEEYVEKLVKVFQEVRRVLQDDGTLWINLGDTYNSRSGGYSSLEKMGMNSYISTNTAANIIKSKQRTNKLKSKNIIGIPWRVAFALQAEGWYLRSDIIWHKPDPMPESVTDRPTKAHEYIFLLSKSKKYYYDNEAIKEPVTWNAHSRGNGVNPKAKIPAGWDTGPGGHTNLNGRYKSKQNESFSSAISGIVEKRNKRSVWTVLKYPFPEAHFATFPPDLIKPCVLAGCPSGGVVLDPFAGSGTTLYVSKEFGRKSIGIELKEDYCKLILKRTQQEVLEFETPARCHKRDKIE